MTRYQICPIVGIEAQKYLADCGCAVMSEILGLPDFMTLDQQTGQVTHEGVILFHMKQIADERWFVTLPRQYQDTFHLVLITYGLNYQTASAILHIPETSVVDMLRDIPVPRQVAAETLQRLSEYTGCPYSLENVRVEVSDDC